MMVSTVGRDLYASSGLKDKEKRAEALSCKKYTPSGFSLVDLRD